MNRKTLVLYRSLRLEREQIEEQLDRLESVRTSPKVQSLTGMPGGGAKPGSNVERLVAQFDALQAQYTRQLNRITALQIEIEHALEALEPVERRLLRAYYLEGLKWQAACDVVGYSRMQAHRIHTAAIAKLEAKEKTDLGRKGDKV